MVDEGENHESEAEKLAKKVRILCWVMTSPEGFDSKAKHVKATWGKRCNKLVFMSSEAEETLPVIKLGDVGRDAITCGGKQGWPSNMFTTTTGDRIIGLFWIEIFVYKLLSNEMVTLFLEQLKLRPHAQCFQQFDAKVKPGKIGYSDVEKVTVIFAVNAVNKARTTQKSSAFLDGF